MPGNICLFAGIVSLKLSLVLLYINQKHSSLRAFTAHDKLLILLKGHFTINKNITEEQFHIVWTMFCVSA